MPSGSASRLGVLDSIAHQGVVRFADPGDVDDAQAGLRVGLECGRPATHDDRADDEVEFVDEACGEQVVPQSVAGEDQNVLARQPFQLGDLFACACSAYDRRRVSDHGAV